MIKKSLISLMYEAASIQRWSKRCKDEKLRGTVSGISDFHFFEWLI